MKIISITKISCLVLLVSMLLQGCNEPGELVGPRPSGEVILERLADRQELNRWTIDKGFLRPVVGRESSPLPYEFQLDLFSEDTDVAIVDNDWDLNGISGEGFRIAIDFRNLWPIPYLESNTCTDIDFPRELDYPEDYGAQYTVSRGTMDGETRMPLGEIVRIYARMWAELEGSQRYLGGLADFGVESSYCREDNIRLTISQSNQNTNWYRVDFYMTEINTYRPSEILRGYYEGPITIFEAVTGAAPISGQVETICGSVEGDADGIPGALSYGDLDFYLSRQNSSIFIADFGNDVVRSYDETNGITTVSESFVGPASIVSLPNEAFEDLYVAETRDKQLRIVKALTAFTEGVLIRDPEGNTLEGDATWFESLAVNQDPSIFQRTIYGLNASVDQQFGNRIVRLDISGGGNRATQSIVAGNGISVADEVINGPADLATFNFPEDIAVDYQDNIYVADGHSIRKIDIQTENVTSLAGLDENGNYLGMPEDYETNNVFDPNGNRIFRGFSSVAYDAFNDRIIATHINNEIWAFSEAGGQL